MDYFDCSGFTRFMYGGCLLLLAQLRMGVQICKVYED
jgi:hypothetical protein